MPPNAQQSGTQAVPPPSGSDDDVQILFSSHHRELIDRSNAFGLPSIPGFAILGLLGKGGMSAVFRAMQLSTKREVALKLIRLAEVSPDADKQFRTEIELLARLEHPNIARIYDATVHQGVCCYAMELVDGLELLDFIAERRLGLPSAVELLRRVAKATHFAHQQGIVHRDLKPGNVLITTQADVKVLDFGLAKSLMIHTRHLAGTSGSGSGSVNDLGIYGTPGYMAPEQAAGRDDHVTERTDVYALGAMLYHVACGRPPQVQEGALHDVLHRIATEQPPRPRQVNRKVPGELEAIIVKAMARDPAARYASADEFARDLKAFLAGEPVSAVARSVGYVFGKRLRRHRASVLFAALGIACVTAGGLAVSRWVNDARARAAAAEAALAQVQNERDGRDSTTSAQRRVASVLFPMTYSISPRVPTTGRTVRVIAAQPNDPWQRMATEELSSPLRAAGWILDGAQPTELVVRLDVSLPAGSSPSVIVSWTIARPQGGNLLADRVLATRDDPLWVSPAESFDGWAQEVIARVAAECAGALAGGEVLIPVALPAPDGPESRQAQSRLVRRDFAGAAELYRAALDEFGPRWEDMLGLAIALEGARDYAAAAATYDQADRIRRSTDAEAGRRRIARYAKLAAP